MSPFKVSRRTLLKQSVTVGAASAGIATGLSGAAAAPSGSGKIWTRYFQSGLTGEITVSFPDELGKKPPFVDQAAQAVQTANSGATVKVDLQKIGEDEFYTKLLLALDAGDAPDAFHVSGASIGELSDAGYIEPLDSYLAKWPDWEEYYPESIRGGVSYDSKVWAIPYGLDTRFLYFRRDDLKTAGLPEDWSPANVAGILEAATAVKASGGDVIPYALYAGQAGSSGTADHAFIPLVWAYGGDVVDSSGKWVGNSPAIVKALTYYQQAFQTDKLVPQEILTTTKPWTAMREKLGNGQLALLFEGGWVYGGWETADKATTDTNIGYLLHPTETGGPSFTIGGPGTCWYINAASKNKDLAFEFLKAFNSTEIVAKLNIEDPHPVARTDSAQLPEFQAQKFLVDSTESLKSARFVPPDPNGSKAYMAIQAATGSVASGDKSPEEAASQYADDLKRALGDDKVVTQ
jgi:multiple sugar transport system substrate-binding protein